MLQVPLSVLYLQVWLQYWKCMKKFKFHNAYTSWLIILPNMKAIKPNDLRICIHKVYIYWKFMKTLKSHNSCKNLESKWWYNMINYTWPIILPNMKVIGPMIEQTDTKKLYDTLLSYTGHKKTFVFKKKKISVPIFFPW